MCSIKQSAFEDKIPLFKCDSVAWRVNGHILVCVSKAGQCMSREDDNKQCKDYSHNAPVICNHASPTGKGEG